jgi:AraC-like DNA-binding protein
MIVNYNLNKLQSVLDDFCLLTGIRISLCDTSVRAITRSTKQDDFCQLMQNVCGSERCRASDEALFQRCLETGKPQLHRCHRGLLDMCVPVLRDGVPLGFLIMGRIRTEQAMPPAMAALFPTELLPRAEQLYRELSYYTEQQATAAANLAAALAAYILSENLILTRSSEEAEALVSYVDAHLCEELTAERLCRDLHLSKTMLYRLFARHMGCGVNCYITARRMEVAKELLVKSSLPVAEICERVGISNHTYFCRLFKKKHGITPLQYRKNT